MSKVVISILAGSLLAWGAAAQSAPPQQEQQEKKTTRAQASTQSSASASAGQHNASADLATDTTIEAKLAKPVDARKHKPGDAVEARTTKDVKSDGKVVIPKNSKLLGRVTEAKARGEGQSESSLGIAFDRAVLKDGREVPLNVVVQAVAAAQTAANAGMHDSGMMADSAASGQARSQAGASRGGSGGGLVGGVTSTVGATAGAATSTVGGVAQTATGTVGATTDATLGAGQSQAGLAGALNSTSSGVIGLKDLSLASESAGSGQGSVITSPTRNVHLDAGTRMLLRVVSAKEHKQQ